MPLIGNDAAAPGDDTPKSYHHENRNVRDNQPAHGDLAPNVRSHSLAACIELRDSNDAVRIRFAHGRIEFQQVWRYGAFPFILLVRNFVEFGRNVACYRSTK